MSKITFNSHLEEADSDKNKELLDSAKQTLEKFYKENKDDSPLVFLNLPQNKDIFKEAKEISEKLKTPVLKYIFLVGMGGSYLGTKAVYDALQGYFEENNLNKKSTPEIIFINNTDSSYLEKIKKMIDSEIEKEEFALLLVSKSGETVETAFNMDFLIKEFENRFKNIAERVAVITTIGSNFEKKADEKGFLKSFIPPKLSGRFSVFSSVSLIPLLLCDFDVEKLREGANDLNNTQILENKRDALFSAISIFENLKEGKNINVEFFFNPELETLGKWLRQLKSESLGKKKNREGEILRSGITSIVAIGPRDLHSLFQLILGGPLNKLTNFVFAFENGGIESAKKVTKALLESVKDVYKEEDIPFTETNLEKISEYSIGWFMQFKMLEMFYLGELLNVDVFNQPEVEKYKEIAKKL